MDSLVAGDLRIDVVEISDPPTLRLDWFGISGDRQPDKILRPYFARVLDAASGTGRCLELHFESIERFNSSTILCIIQLIQEARKANVRLTLVYDASRKWQRLSFDALRIFDRKDGMFELSTTGAA